MTAASESIRVLVTGGAGFLGRGVVAALAAEPRVDAVVAADVRDVPPGERHDGVEYAVLDVRDGAAVDAAVAAARPTAVVHLAAIVTPGGDSSRALEYAVDVEGTQHVVDACLRHGVGQLVVTSSGAAYGYYADNPDWLDEDDALRGNESFAYSHHKRLVEELLARARTEHPELKQLILRPGTVLGERVQNQITNLFHKPLVLGVAGSPTPFVFIWDRDVVAIVVQGILQGSAGRYNLAGDGAVPLAEIARLLGKPYVPVPAALIRGALRLLKPLGLSRYGPEQVDFLRYRPVLANTRLKAEFGYTPQLTSRQAFLAYARAAGLVAPDA